MSLPTPMALPVDPEPARDPRWETVYATIRPVTDPFEGHRVTVHLTVGHRDLTWWTDIPWQQYGRIVGNGFGWMLDKMVAGIHDSVGWADADRRAHRARLDAEVAAIRADREPPPSLLAAYDAAHDSFYEPPPPRVDPYVRAAIADLAAERDKPRDRDAVIIAGV